MNTDETLAAIEALPDGRRMYVIDGTAAILQSRMHSLDFDTGDLKQLAAELTTARALLAEATVIEGKNWSISNNGNPAGLIALRQFDDRGNLLSYTHHDTAAEAFAAVREGQK